MLSVQQTTAIPNSTYQLAIPYTGTESLEGLKIAEDQLALFKAETKEGSVARIPAEFGSYLLVGSKPGRMREFVANATRAAATGSPVVFDLGEAVSPFLIAEAAMLAGKTKTLYKSTNSAQEIEVIVITSAKNSEQISTAEVIANEVLAAREVINMPANDLYPQALADIATARAKGLPLEVEVWDEVKLAEEKCGGILGVGQGSERPPRLVKISYRGGGKHIGFAGKGITFDTGGLSLKPAESMVGMKYDMAGAASVLAATLAIARLGLKVDITCVLCVAENMPSGKATRPGDVVKIRNGKTVEVLNTDAEGRLVLADGLSVLGELAPDHIIDVATLTGAATIALGKRYSGLMGHGDAIQAVQKAAEDVGELVWHMPLPEEIRSTLDSDLADLANVKIGNRAGGMLVGGWFLKEFVPEGGSWAHIDIASAANNDGSPYSIYPAGATGVIIRTLVQFARNQAASE